MDQGFYSTIVELAKIGSAGVGVAVLLMVFIMVIRGKPVDTDTARLRERFLTWGVGFAVVVGLLALIPSITGTTGTPVLLRLAFSPDFQTEGLSPPKVQLPDGKIVQPDQIFALQPSPAAQVVTVGVDKGLNEVRNLRQASAKLAQTVQSVAEQRDALATQAASATGAPAAKENLQAQSQQSAQLQNQVVRSIQVGDFANANALSARLHTSVIAARPAVEAISRSRPE